MRCFQVRFVFALSLFLLLAVCLNGEYSLIAKSRYVSIYGSGRTAESTLRLRQELDEGTEHRKITEVSGGQLQRASICRAVLHNPDILFGDEPTGALNSKSSEEILDLFEALNKKGMTILLVTHDAKVSARAKRVVFMKDGALESELRFKNEDHQTRLGLIIDKMSALGI